MKKIFTTLFLVLFTVGALAQPAGFTRSGSPLPFATSAASNAAVMIDRGGGQSPANMTMGTLAANLGRKFDPTWFGAVGDNTTDDHAAMQATIHAASAEGGKVVLPRQKRFRISAALYVTNAVTIEGEAAGNSSLQAIPVLRFDGTGANCGIKITNNFYGFEMRNVYVQGPGITGDFGVSIVGTMPVSMSGFKFEDVSIRGFATGFYGTNCGVGKLSRINFGGGMLTAVHSVGAVNFSMNYDMVTMGTTDVGFILSGGTHSLTCVELGTTNYAVKAYNNARVTMDQVNAESLGGGTPRFLADNSVLMIDGGRVLNAGAYALALTNTPTVWLRHPQWADANVAGHSIIRWEDNAAQRVYAEGTRNEMRIFTTNATTGATYSSAAFPMMIDTRNVGVTDNRNAEDNHLESWYETWRETPGNTDRWVLIVRYQGTNYGQANLLEYFRDRKVLGRLWSRDSVTVGMDGFTVPTANTVKTWAMLAPRYAGTTEDVNLIHYTSYDANNTEFRLGRAGLVSPTKISFNPSATPGVGGTLVGSIETTGWKPAVPMLLADGDATTPTLRFLSEGGSLSGWFKGDENEWRFSSGGAERFAIGLGGPRIVSPTVPTSATSAGIAGQIAWDADYIYVCTAANTWKRVAIATW